MSLLPIYAAEHASAALFMPTSPVQDAQHSYRPTPCVERHLREWQAVSN
jgi:hypothetical protein